MGEYFDRVGYSATLHAELVKFKAKYSQYRPMRAIILPRTLARLALPVENTTKTFL